MIHIADVAESQVGVYERTGRNDGIPAERYADGDEVEWCAAFVLWCNRVSDDVDFAPDIVDHYRLRKVSSFVAWAKERDRFHARGTIVPQRNDVIFFEGHVGVVVALDDGLVKTVEGNSGNKVARRNYLTGDRKIVGYLR